MTVPASIPQTLTTGQVARLLNLKEASIKTRLDSGVLRSVRLGGERGWRYVTPEEVVRFAEARGLTVTWDALENYL